MRHTNRRDGQYQSEFIAYGCFTLIHKPVIQMVICESDLFQRKEAIIRDVIRRFSTSWLLGKSKHKNKLSMKDSTGTGDGLHPGHHQRIASSNTRGRHTQAWNQTCVGGWTLDVVTWENLGHCDLWLKPLNCFKKETPPSKKNWLGSKFRRFTMGKQRQKNCPANVRTNLLLSVWRRNYKTSFTWLFASCVVGGWTLDTWENLGRRGVKRKSAI